MMKKLFTTLLMTLFICLFTANSQAKIYADGNETTQIIPGAENYTFEFPLTTDAVSKAFSSPINVSNSLQYIIQITGDESLGLDKVYGANESVEGQKSWKKYAKAGGVLTPKVEGSSMARIFEQLERNGWPDRDIELKVIIETMANLNGDMTTIAETKLLIPVSVKAEYKKAANAEMAQKSKEVVKSFQSGNYADLLRDSKLSTAIERYMENKWSDDVTTVSGRSLVYEDMSKTKFRFEAYYIIKKSNGICKYNSCYGDAMNYGDRYAVTWFNSMNAEKEMLCEDAAKVSNR